MGYVTISDCDRCGSRADLKHVDGEGIDLCQKCINSIELSVESRTANGKYDAVQVKSVIFMLIRSRFATITKR